MERLITVMMILMVVVLAHSVSEAMQIDTTANIQIILSK